MKSAADLTVATTNFSEFYNRLISVSISVLSLASPTHFRKIRQGSGTVLSNHVAVFWQLEKQGTGNETRTGIGTVRLTACTYTRRTRMCDPLLSAIEHGTQATKSVVMERAVYNHWTELVDWTGGLDWWTDTKNQDSLACRAAYVNPKTCTE